MTHRLRSLRVSLLFDIVKRDWLRNLMTSNGRRSSWIASWAWREAELAQRAASDLTHDAKEQYAVAKDLAALVMALTPEEPEDGR